MYKVWVEILIQINLNYFKYMPNQASKKVVLFRP